MAVVPRCLPSGGGCLTVLRDGQEAHEAQALDGGHLRGNRAGGERLLPAPRCPCSRKERPGQPVPHPARSHLPVNVLLYEAGAFTDVEALQESCSRARGSITIPMPTATV